MPPVVIDNPILNSPFKEPSRHFRFSEEGITDEAVDGRRESGYFLPIASPRKKGGQLKFETEWTQDRFQSSPRINRIRERVSAWRRGGYVGCSRVTDRLLRYWSDPNRERKLFFCQIEALETAVYQLLLLLEFAHDAADRIYHSIVSAYEGEPILKPILRPYDTVGSTRWVDFDTIKNVWPTRADKCHVSHVVADTGSWEQKLAQVLEELDEVTAYVKNQGLNFTIPYTINGDERQYYPDFLVKAGEDLTLIVEVSGESRKDKAAKVAAARTLWVPAVNNHGGFGRWGFLEVTDPWDAKGVIRQAIANATMPAGAA